MQKRRNQPRVEYDYKRELAEHAEACFNEFGGTQAK